MLFFLFFFEILRVLVSRSLFRFVLADSVALVGYLLPRHITIAITTATRITSTTRNLLHRNYLTTHTYPEKKNRHLTPPTKKDSRASSGELFEDIIF